ncbi:hypothetical protein TESG_06680 [Trichophyton tonsurans CBS 112818]|uniref:Uncharacterized protein n=1 Tax=Trichophyton tonsurans (strain CBS 112818) TaxID=647933 RepID=F2S6P2_TRIT1|nr:hypothetical protein TESG_06680 [Trichophyton tonsurans CBS 112818]
MVPLGKTEPAGLLPCRKEESSVADTTTVWVHRGDCGSGEIRCSDRIFHKEENKNGVRQQRSGNYQISTPSDPIYALPPSWRRILGSSNQKPRQNFTIVSGYYC